MTVTVTVIAPPPAVRALAAVAALLALAAVAPPWSPAQDAGGFAQPLGLFQDMAADTVTAARFAIDGPVPHVRLQGEPPVPGDDFAMATVMMVCGDYDADGWTDVLLSANPVRAFGETRNATRLLWGRPDGTFETGDQPSLPTLTWWAARGDVDGDGRTDLVVLETTGIDALPRFDHLGHRETESYALLLLRNLGGRRFDRQVIGGNMIPALLADLDGDGWLDLLGAAAPREGQPAVMAGGPAGFAPVAVGAPAPAGPPLWWWADLDGDGAIEVRAHHGIPVEIEQLSFGGSGSFRLLDPLGEGRAAADTLLPPMGYGAPALADVDRDGRPDIFAGATDMAGGRNLLLLSGKGYRDGIATGRDAGLWAGYAYTRGAWGDVDNDGRPDLWQARHVADAGHTRSRFYWHRDDGAFVDATATVAPPAEPSSSAAAWLDADGDGRLDLLAAFETTYYEVVPLDRCRPRLYRNRGTAGRWLRVDLEGRPPNTDAIGASVVLWAGGRPQWQQVGNVNSARTAPPLSLHFGLGEADRADSVVVQWPWGPRQVWRDLEAGRRHVLRQR